MSKTITYTTTVDSWTYSSSTSANYGTSQYHYLCSSPTAYAYIWFPLPVPLGSIVSSATLSVYLYAAWAGGPHTLTAKRITTTWAENTITYSNAPTVSATNSATAAVTAGTANQKVDFTVTNMISDVAGGATWFGIRLEKNTTTMMTIHSSESYNTAYVPTLTVTYTVLPDAPKNLKPSGDKAVSEAAPTVVWEYSHATGDAQAYSQVQVNDTPNFTTPLFDSGYVGNTYSQYDLSTDGSPPSLSDNTDYYWRVRVKDVAGGESPWSDTAQFERRTKGSLSITSPANDNDDVEELSPTFVHDFTVRTQYMVQHTLFYRLSSSYDWTQIYQDSPSIDLTESWQLPTTNAITVPTGDYKYRLWVWDTYTRESVPGDMAYVEAERIFQYNPTAGVTPVSNLTATTTDSPLVTIEWTRASTPDYFHLAVDGEIKRAFILPGDVFVSGTDYSLDWWGATPGVEHEYSIIAVVDTAGVMKSSTSNPTVDATANFVGIWLIAEDDNLTVCIVGRETVEASLGEDSATFFPRGRRSPVRIKGLIRGLEGTFSGMLTAFGNNTAKQWLDNFHAIKALPPTANIRISYGHHNFPIILGNVAESEFPIDEIYTVSGEFWQVGEFEVEETQ